jgi:hypothetical protein
MKLNTDGKLTHEIIMIDGVPVDHWLYKQVVKLPDKKLNRKETKDGKHKILRNIHRLFRLRSSK